MKPEELDERLSDTEAVLSQQGKRIKDLENKEYKLPQIQIPDYSGELKLIRYQLQLLGQDTKLVELRQTLQAIEAFLKKEQKPIKKEYRFLLFPETNQGYYYRIVFGRLIPWGLCFVAATYLFSLASKGIEAWEVRKYNSEAERYIKAWNYLEENSNKKIKKEMAKAWKKSSEKDY